MNRLLRHLKPSGGVALARVSTLWVGDTIRTDLYYVAKDKMHHLFPLLRELWSLGFITYWEFVGEVLPGDREREFTVVGDVDASTVSIEDLADELNELEE